MISKDQLVVVIRSAGERTEQLCKKLIQQVVDESQVLVIREVPFEGALRKSFQIGLKSNAKWLLVIDADLLVLPESVLQILSEADAEPEDVFHLQGIIYDKFFLDYRKAGPRLYRVKSLSKAVELIPADGVEIRPEFSTIKKMESIGFRSKSSDIVFGVHDYEQFYGDVYRKCVVHAFKHKSEIDVLIKKWVSRTDDIDYRVALAASLDAFTIYESVSIDKRLFEVGWNQLKKRVGLSEKDENFDLSQVENNLKLLLDEAGPIPEYMKNLDQSQIINSRSEFTKNMIAQKGIFSAIRYLCGQTIVKIGTVIRG